MADFAKVAEEVFRVLDSFNYTVLLYDDQEMLVTEPSEARLMFDREHNIMVSITDDDDDSRVVLHLGKHTPAAKVMGMIQTLRNETTKYNMTFQLRNYNKEIDPKQFSRLASISESEDMSMEVLEGMYGTSRSSYLRLENAKMIVRHKTRIDDSKAGARSRCIETILIENAVGERHRFPTTNLAAARAMTQHVNQGGAFADPVGQQVTQMAMEYGNLATASKHLSAMPLSESVTAVREACGCKMHKLKKTFESLYRASSYAAEAADLAARANLLTESDVKIDEVRLTELRQLLHDCDDEVVECTARAMDEVDEAIIVEADSSVDVLGHRVSRQAWDDLDHGKIRLKNRPVFDRRQFTSALAEIVYRLGQIVPTVQDDSLANLLADVSETVWDSPNKKTLALIGLKAIKAARRHATYPEVQETPMAGSAMATPLAGFKVNANAWNDLMDHHKIIFTGKPVFGHHRFTNRLAKLIFSLGQIVPRVKDDSLGNLLAHVVDELAKDDAPDKRHLMEIGIAAIKAALHVQEPEHDLADKNDVIQEWTRWVAQFSAERVLIEGEDLFSPMHPYNPIHQPYNDALDNAVASFDPEYFLDDEDFGLGEQIAERDDTDPDENKLDKRSVIGALEYYLRHEIENSSGIAVDDDKAIHDLAMQVYDSVVTALQDRGFIVKDEVTEDVSLTREDVLLPPKNQGDSLAAQVSKATVPDPDNKDHEKKPDDEYISRMKTLAGINSVIGMNSGANSGGY